MSFFGKIKNWLGLGGVKIRLEMNPNLSKEELMVKGKVVITTKSEQELVSLEIELEEEFSTGRGDSRKTKFFDLGEMEMQINEMIKPGEEKVFEFEFPFTLMKSNADQLKEKGGALGALGKASKWASNERSNYFVKAKLDVKKVALDPYHKIRVNII